MCIRDSIKITVAAGLMSVVIIYINSMVFYYPLEYTLMEITDSLSNDIKNAPDWFHTAISHGSRKEIFNHPLGKLTYQVWDRKDAQDIILLIHGTGAHKKWWDPIGPLLNNKFSVIAPDLPGMGESCLLYTSPSPRDATLSRMPSSA